MSMRLYKINGQYYTWDYLHNELGYTESASTTTTYKSSDSDTWGQLIVDSGYRIATDSSDLETYEFWIDNISGWFNASEIAQEGYYPSFATDGPRFVKEGELSVSVEISGNSWSGAWYLLKKDVSIGWCTERELEENGWEPDRGEIVGGLISDTYDKRIYSFGNGGLLAPGGYAYPDGDLLGMDWDFGGVVKPLKGVSLFGVMNSAVSNDVTFMPEDLPFGVLKSDALPTVTSLNGAVGTLSQQGTQASVADGDYVYHWIYVNSAYQLSTIGAGNTLGIVRISNNRAEDIQRGVGWVAERTSDGYIKITNNSGTTYANLYGAWLAYCNSTSVTVVTVYKLSDGVAYNAFKYVLNGTDYYYVLDNTTGSTMDWTDNLASIGYSLYPFDTTSGTIAALTVPNEHQYQYVDVLFNSLRYYAQVTISNTGSITGNYFGTSGTFYYGTVTWTDSSLEDLTDKIAVVNDLYSTAVQSVFRIIFINNSHISGYHPDDTIENSSGYITEYTYNDGVHSITFYLNNVDWWYGQYQGSDGRIQIRYLNGTTTFNGLSAFDLINVSSIHAISKQTNTARYDMYQSWGGTLDIFAFYSEDIPIPRFNAYLTTQGASGTSDSYSSSHGYTNIYDENGQRIPFDDSKTYILEGAKRYNGESRTMSGYELYNDNGYLSLYNSNYGAGPAFFSLQYLAL